MSVHNVARVFEKHAVGFRFSTVSATPLSKNCDWQRPARRGVLSPTTTVAKRYHTSFTGHDRGRGKL